MAVVVHRAGDVEYRVATADYLVPIAVCPWAGGTLDARVAVGDHGVGRLELVDYIARPAVRLSSALLKKIRICQTGNGKQLQPS